MFMAEGLDGTSFHWEQYVERQQAFVDRVCQTYISPRSSTHLACTVKEPGLVIAQSVQL